MRTRLPDFKMGSSILFNALSSASFTKPNFQAHSVRVSFSFSISDMALKMIGSLLVSYVSVATNFSSIVTNLVTFLLCFSTAIRMSFCRGSDNDNWVFKYYFMNQKMLAVHCLPIMHKKLMMENTCIYIPESESTLIPQIEKFIRKVFNKYEQYPFNMMTVFLLYVLICFVSNCVESFC